MDNRITILKQHILRHAERISVPLQRVEELSNISLFALGEEFFGTKKYVINPITKERRNAHPLLDLLDSVNSPELGITELIELGLYLETFCSDEAIKEYIACLKDVNHYKSLRYQLAMAFRFKKCGFAVKFEPKTIKGKSDISLFYEGKEYIVECYRINKTFLDYTGEFHFALSETLFNKVSDNRKYEFIFKTKQIFTFDGMRKIIKKFIELVKEFNDRDELIDIEIKFGNNFLGIRDITNQLLPKGMDEEEFIAQRQNELKACCLCQTKIMSRNIFGASDELEKNKIRGNRFFYSDRFEGSIGGSPYSILKKKLSKKFKQTKVANKEVGRILCVHIPFGLIDLQNKMHGQLLDQATRNFDRVSALILTTEEARQDRFQFKGAILIPDNEHAFPKTMIKKFNDIELSNIFEK